MYVCNHMGCQPLEYYFENDQIFLNPLPEPDEESYHMSDIILMGSLVVIPGIYILRHHLMKLYHQAGVRVNQLRASLFSPPLNQKLFINPTQYENENENKSENEKDGQNQVSAELVNKVTKEFLDDIDEYDFVQNLELEN